MQMEFGVRFDRSIPQGNDIISGFCEDHGFFCAATSLCLDSSGGDVQKLVVNELFVVASNENQSLNVVCEGHREV